MRGPARLLTLLGNLPDSRKLTLISLFSTGLALVTAILVLVYYYSVEERVNGIFQLVLAASILAAALACLLFSRLQNLLETSKSPGVKYDEHNSPLRAARNDLLRKDSMATLGQLTATVSHELRNPLGTIQVSLQSLKESLGDPDPAITRIINRMERNILRCDSIISELLDYTRLTPLDYRPANLDEWITSLIDEYQVPGNIRVETDLGVDREIRFDHDRIWRALVNIIDNACQAMINSNSDNSRLQIKTRINGNNVEITCQDNGPGIEPDIMSHIYEPFYSTRELGIGLGLTIVKQIMELHDGGVIIDNLDHSGARVTLWMPLRGVTGSGLV